VSIATAESWLQAIPTLVVVLALLLAPGAMALRLARCDSMTIVGLAGPVSVSTVAVGGLVAGAMGIPWGAATVAASTGVLWAVAAGVGTLRRERLPRTLPAWRGWFAAGIVVAAVVGAIPAMLAMGAPNALPQSPDTIFHVGTIQSMASLQDVSVLHAVDFVRPGETGFYPAAFNALSATVVLLTGSAPITAANLVALVSGFVVWPLGLAFLASEALGLRARFVLPAAVVAVVYPAYATWPLGYGVLWPNLLGQAMLAASVALVVRAVHGRARQRWAAVGGAALLVPGLVAAHPSAIFALGALTLTIVLAALLAAAATGSGARRLLPLLAGAALVVISGAAWVTAGRLVPSMRGSNPTGPEMSQRAALLDISLAAFRSQTPLYVASALALVGLVLALRHPRARWLPLAWVGLAAAYYANTAIDSDVTRWATWPWYNNSPRLAMLLVLPLALLVTVSLGEVVRVAMARSRWSRRSGQAWTSAAVVLLFLVVTAGGHASARFETLEAYYPPDGDARQVSRVELEALEEIAAELPPDAVVAANPWRGGQYLPLVGGPAMLFPTEKTIRADPVQLLLGARLADVGTDPEVCRLAMSRGVEWALTGGELATSARSATTLYRGVDGVVDSPAWEMVLTAGPYTLHRMSSCAS
jgi:hypothetical protein